MSSQKQIDANRQNAQNSHGATTPEGQKRSSLNATQHGWTGQTLVLSPEEQAPYAQFVKDYLEEWQPFDFTTRQLTQQLADAHWSLHQIVVQQSNLLSMINAATAQLNETAVADSPTPSKKNSRPSSTTAPNASRTKFPKLPNSPKHSKHWANPSIQPILVSFVPPSISTSFWRARN